MIGTLQLGQMGLSGAAPSSYATWNPADKSPLITLSNGNLTATSNAGFTTVRSTLSVSSGKWYWEIYSDSGGANRMVGIATAAATLSGYVGSTVEGWGYHGQNGNKYHGPPGGFAYGATYAVGDVIGVALDMDTGTLTFYKNGVSQGVAFTGIAGTIFAGISSTNSAFVMTANFGAAAFVYAAPAGYNPGIGYIP